MTGMIFIVGNSRSGTTMLGRIFGNHSMVYMFEELHFFEHLIDGPTIRERPIWPDSKCIDLLERLISSAHGGFFKKVTPGKYTSEANYILTQTTTKDPISLYAAFLKYITFQNKKLIPCEQTPRYLFYASEILEAFPEARIINMVRDPRDVLLSQKKKWRLRFQGTRSIPLQEAFRSWVNYHPYTISLLWLGALRKAEEMESHSRFISIRYEDLLVQPETTIRSLCKFTNINFESQMLNIPQIGSSTELDNPSIKGINSSRAGSWQRGGLTRTELWTCQQVTSEQMKRMGYNSIKISTTVLLRVASSMLFIFKSSIALILNLHRTQNLRETLIRRLKQSRLNK